MYITYPFLLTFLTVKEQLNQKDIAEDLKVSPSSISRLLNGKTPQMSSIVTKDNFYQQLFCQEAYPEYVQKIYQYLHECDASDQELDALYNKISLLESEHKSRETVQKAREAFLRQIVERAEESREEKRVNEADPSQVISFAPLNYRLTEGFVGRTDLLDKLSSVMKKYGLAVLCGIGGLGKSQAALHYADRRKRDHTYEQVQMVYFHQDLKTTIQDIPFQGLKKYQKEDKAGDEGLQVRMKALKALHEDALLIIDNMDIMGATLPEEDQRILEELADMELHVLITSLNTTLYKEMYMVPIKPLNDEEQLELFRLNYSPRKEGPIELPAKNIDKFKEICRMVSGHTMLIELIAKTMREYTMSPAKMITVLKEKKDTRDLKIPVEKDNNYEQEDIYNLISTLFNISAMNERAKQILMKLALCSINGVRMTFFDEFLLDGCSISAINVLVNQSWIIRESHQAAEDDRIHLHPLIETAVLRNLHPTIETCQDYLDAAIRVYTSNDEEIQAMDRHDVCTILIRAGELFHTSYDRDSVGLLIRQAKVIYKAHQYRQAWRQCNLALSICKDSPDDASQALLPQAYCLHADLAVKLADYQTAIRDYHTAISMWEGQAHPPYKDIVEAYNHLANVYRKDSQYTEALDNFRLAENRMDVHDIDNPELHADILNNIGIVYINLDNLDKALENYKKGMEIREKQAVPNKQQLAYSYHNIGTVYQRQHRCEDAIIWHEKGLKLRREVYTPDDPTIADSLTMLGNDYAAMAVGREDEHYVKALKYVQEGLKIRENSLGPDHPATAWSYESLGKIYYQQEAYAQAKEAFLRCLSIRRNSLGKRHAYTAQVMIWLGKTESKLGNLSEAREYLTKACTIQEQVKPSAVPQTRALLDGIEDPLPRH